MGHGEGWGLEYQYHSQRCNDHHNRLMEGVQSFIDEPGACRRT